MSEMYAFSYPESKDPEIEAFINALEMRARILGGGHLLLQSFDRLACPMPGKLNMERLKASAMDITKWSVTLPVEEKKMLDSMMSQHIKLSVEYLKAMSLRASAERQDKQGEQQKEEEAS